jgi:hypothetical protein
VTSGLNFGWKAGGSPLVEFLLGVNADASGVVISPALVIAAPASYTKLTKWRAIISVPQLFLCLKCANPYWTWHATPWFIWFPVNDNIL